MADKPDPLLPRLILVGDVKSGDRIALDLGRIKTRRRNGSSIMLYRECGLHGNYSPDTHVILLDRPEAPDA